MVTGSTTTGTEVGEDSAGGARIGTGLGVDEGPTGRLAVDGGRGASVLTGFIGTSWRCCTAMATAGTAISPASRAAPCTVRRVSFRRLLSP